MRTILEEPLYIYLCLHAFLLKLSLRDGSFDFFTPLGLKTKRYWPKMKATVSSITESENKSNVDISTTDSLVVAPQQSVTNLTDIASDNENDAISMDSKYNVNTNVSNIEMKQETHKMYKQLRICAKDIALSL